MVTIVLFPASDLSILYRFQRLLSTLSCRNVIAVVERILQRKEKEKEDSRANVILVYQRRLFYFCREAETLGVWNPQNARGASRAYLFPCNHVVSGNVAILRPCDNHNGDDRASPTSPAEKGKQRRIGRRKGIGGSA